MLDHARGTKLTEILGCSFNSIHWVLCTQNRVEVVVCSVSRHLGCPKHTCPLRCLTCPGLCFLELTSWHRLHPESLPELRGESPVSFLTTTKATCLGFPLLSGTVACVNQRDLTVLPTASLIS